MYLNINLPTWITLFRVITVPFIVLFFYVPCSFCPLFSAIIFAFASLTDWCDGFLARRLGQITIFGTFLDPIVDKILVIVALVLIEEHFHTCWITFPVIGIIIREVIISALREWVARIGNHSVHIIVSRASKIKTTMQMFAIILLLWHYDMVLITLGTVFLYIAFVLTVWSISRYFYMVYKNGLFTK